MALSIDSKYAVGVGCLSFIAGAAGSVVAELVRTPLVQSDVEPILRKNALRPHGVVGAENGLDLQSLQTDSPNVICREFGFVDDCDATCSIRRGLGCLACVLSIYALTLVVKQTDSPNVIVIFVDEGFYDAMLKHHENGK